MITIEIEIPGELANTGRHQVPFRTSKGAKQYIAQAAQAMHMTTAEFLRTVAFQAAHRINEGRILR